MIHILNIVLPDWLPVILFLSFATSVALNIILICNIAVRSRYFQNPPLTEDDINFVDNNKHTNTHSPVEKDSLKSKLTEEDRQLVDEYYKNMPPQES